MKMKRKEKPKEMLTHNLILKRRHQFVFEERKTKNNNNICIYLFLNIKWKKIRRKKNNKKSKS